MLKRGRNMKRDQNEIGQQVSPVNSPCFVDIWFIFISAFVRFLHLPYEVKRSADASSPFVVLSCRSETDFRCLLQYFPMPCLFLKKYSFDITETYRRKTQVSHEGFRIERKCVQGEVILKLIKSKY